MLRKNQKSQPSNQCEQVGKVETRKRHEVILVGSQLMNGVSDLNPANLIYCNIQRYKTVARRNRDYVLSLSQDGRCCHFSERFIGECHPITRGDKMSRRTVTIDPALDQIIKIIRGLALLIGLEYNYTEVVNGLAYYGVCYWLNIEKSKAVAMAPQVLTTNLKMAGIEDELRDKFYESLSKLTTQKSQ